MHTYLSVCIAECLGLLIGSIRINRFVVFSIREVRLYGLIFLMIWGSIARVTRRFLSCWVAWFALEGHDVIGINCLGRWARSMSRSSHSRRHLGDEGVECRRPWKPGTGQLRK
jgi:hypothetical protein